MPAQISENYLSRPFTLGQQAGRELIYDVWRTDDEDEVKELLLATAPATYQGLIPESVSAEPEGGGVWKGRVRYVLLDEDEYTFETSGGTQHITQSRWTRGRYAPPGKTAPNFQGAIGVGEDSVEGCEIVVPKYEFSETHRFPAADVTPAFKATLFRLTGRTNHERFKGFAQGEVLFLGASGSKRADGYWSITFKFAASPNAEGLEVGGSTEPYGEADLGDLGSGDEDPYGDAFGYGYDADAFGYGDDFGFNVVAGPAFGSDRSGAITGIAKRGWDYLWIRYADFEDAGAKALVKRPVAVYVECVYRRGDLSRLRIGVD